MHLTGASHQVGAHCVQLTGKSLEDGIAEDAIEGLVHPPSLRQ